MPCLVDAVAFALVLSLKPGLGLREHVFAPCDSWASLVPGQERQRWDTRYLVLHEVTQRRGVQVGFEGLLPARVTGEARECFLQDGGVRGGPVVAGADWKGGGCSGC